MTEFNAVTLLPCPFCGGEAVLDVHDDPSRVVEFVVTRCKCGISKEHRTEAAATKWWNTRALSTPAPQVEREAIARCIDPGAWLTRDGVVMPFSEGRGAGEKDQRQLYQQAYEAGVRTADEAHAWFLDSCTDGALVQRSLAKADAILALGQATNSPGDAGASHNTGERNPSVMPDSSPGELRKSGGAK